MIQGGLRDDGSLNLKYMAFKQDGNNFSRYTSTYQAGVEDGSLMRYYRENFENLKCFGPDVPEYLYSTFKSWGFVLVLRTTPTIHSLNYTMDFPDGNINLPVVRASDYKLGMSLKLKEIESEFMELG